MSNINSTNPQSTDPQPSGPQTSMLGPIIIRLSNSLFSHSMIWGGACMVAALAALIVFDTGTLSQPSLFSGVLLGLSLAAAIMSFLMLRTAGNLRVIKKHQEFDSAIHLTAQKSAGYLDDMTIGFFVLGSDGVFRYVNTVFAGWFGMSPETLLDRDARFVDLMVDPAAPSSGGAGRIAMRGKDGEAFDAFIIHEHIDAQDDDDVVRGVVLRDFEAFGRSETTALGSANDGADKKPGDLSTDLSSQPLWLFEDSPVGIALLSDNGTILKANNELIQYLSSNDQNLIGSQVTKYVSAEDREEISSALSKLMMGTAKAVRIDVRLPVQGGQERAASLYFSTKQDDKGEDGLVLHVIDETEHRHLEVQFTQSQKMQAVGQLAGGVAHDFNNLLTAMIGFSDLLLEKHGPDDPSFDDIMQIRQNANRATNLVRQLLAFSRKQTLAPVVIEPGEALADLTHLLGRLIDEQVELILTNAPDAYLFQADRGQFDQVIINLAVNARDAMPGGGSLSITTRNETVLAPLQRGAEIMSPGAYLVIDVADSGTGISRENLERIFEPFYSTKEVGAGTGLGLSTVYGIVHQSGGFIFVESAIGLGTTFSIYLPAYGTEGEAGAEAAAQAADKALTERRAAIKSGSNETVTARDLSGDSVILLVEDEDAVRMFGARALRNKGYTVIEADNGEAGLDALNGADQTIDLIVSDVVMPGMDGHTFVQLVRQEIPDMKVILMSGYAEDVFREEISRDETLHFLAKPFSLKTLASTVKDVLSE